MTEKGKNILYIILCLTMSFLLYKEYTYELPFNHTGLTFLAFLPSNSTLSITWFFLLLMAFILTLPLFNKGLIGLLGLSLLIAVICKPIIIHKIPTQDSISFFEPRKNEMREIIEQFKKSQNYQAARHKIEHLGFEQFKVEGDTYIFIVHSFMGNGQGYCFVGEGILPKSILGESTFFERIDANWYKFSFG